MENLTASNAYSEIPANEAYALQNPGGIILLCTKDIDGPIARHDVAPLAWCTPYEYDPVSKLLVVCDIAHKTFHDIQKSNKCVIAFPSFEMRGLVEKLGSVSGFDCDKFERFHVPYFRAHTMDIRVPEGVVGWMECSVERIIQEGTSGFVMAAVAKAFAEPDCWKRRLHYLNDSIWYKPGDLIAN